MAAQDFSRSIKGYRNAAGNPPAKDYTTYRTAYFWEEILQKDSWLELIGRFLHLQKDEFIVDGKKYWKENMLFPALSPGGCSKKIKCRC